MNATLPIDAIPQTETVVEPYLREEVKKLAKVIDNGYVSLARMLYQVAISRAGVNHWPLWKVWGFDTLNDYAEKELGVSRERVKILTDIWRTLEVDLAGVSQGTRDRLTSLGYTKMQSIFPFLSEESVEAWLTRAEGNTCDGLKGIVRQYRIDRKAKAEELNVSEEAVTVEVPEKEEWQPFQTKMPLPEWASLQQALNKAGRISGSEHVHVNLALMATDFLASSAGAESVDTKAAYLARFESILGVRLAIVDPETKQLKYGLDTLSVLAQG